MISYVFSCSTLESKDSNFKGILTLKLLALTCLKSLFWPDAFFHKLDINYESGHLSRNFIGIIEMVETAAWHREARIRNELLQHLLFDFGQFIPKLR